MVAVLVVTSRLEKPMATKLMTVLCKQTLKRGEAVMKKVKTEKPDAKSFRLLNPEEHRLIKGGVTADGASGLLAFPFIQQAM
jgi:hypothetical protein